MQKYGIVFAPTAAEDLDKILAWLTEEAPEKVEEWFAALKEDINSLSQMPERCPLAPENGMWGDEVIRQFLFQQYPSKYRILFTINGESVRILNVRHGARRFLHEE
ncbi:MAG: plasmid stabilization system protein ParE [Verrucomicrobiales bacterium]|jgi:plasmid stabilization system protein ParE